MPLSDKWAKPKEYVCPNCGDTFLRKGARSAAPWCNDCAEKKYRKPTQKEQLAAALARVARLEAALKEIAEYRYRGGVCPPEQDLDSPSAAGIARAALEVQP